MKKQAFRLAFLSLASLRFTNRHRTLPAVANHGLRSKGAVIFDVYDCFSKFSGRILKENKIRQMLCCMKQKKTNKKARLISISLFCILFHIFMKFLLLIFS